MRKARRFVQAEARAKPGTAPPSALRLSEASALLEQFRDTVWAGRARFEQLCEDRQELSSIGFALAMNSLKLTSSTLVVDLVGRAMQVCGIASYRHDSPYSLGRYLRDAYGAGLMVNNDRIHQINGQLLLAVREP